MSKDKMKAKSKDSQNKTDFMEKTDIKTDSMKQKGNTVSDDCGSGSECK